MKVHRANWEHMPHAGHLIIGQDCRFHLNTKVGKYIVSTVGEYFPDEGIREIFAKSRRVKLEGMGDARRADYMRKIGYEDIGLDRKYETMVFRAQKSERDCCPWEMKSPSNIDMRGYNDPGEARKGHIAMCRKYAKA